MRRGDIYSIRLPKRTGNEQYGKRHAVIVQADSFLPRSTILIAPTSTSARPASFRPELEMDGQKTRVLVEQTTAVDATRLGDFKGHLQPDELWSVDEALETVLDLN